MRSCLLLYILPLVLFMGCRNNRPETYDNYVILVSFDAFRWDYPDHYPTPNLDRIEAEGVKADRLIPSFPSLTFPNHYTIATGLYPDHHGLIHNKFIAPDLGKFYRISDRSMVEDPSFYGGEPLWVTARKQGMITASYFWVGSEAAIEGLHPDYWKSYEESDQFTARVDTVIKWLSLPLNERPRFITLYFQEPDATGHDFGPLSQETGAMVARLDSVIGYLRQEISRLPYGDRVNLIILADHGMGPISPEKYVNISAFLDKDRVVSLVGSNPVYLLDVKDGYEDSAVAVLDRLEGVEAFRKEKLPEHLHYGTHPRIPDIVVFADSSWSIGPTDHAESYTGGAHGFDPADSDMGAIFYAAGPGFKKGYHQTGFQNIEVYNIVCELLGLQPADNDGNPEIIREMLK
ncbi:MAG: ectonucleotide pyrophosphatase/phosphodiesterase [Bacteroidota bacterium]